MPEVPEKVRLLSLIVQWFIIIIIIVISLGIFSVSWVNTVSSILIVFPDFSEG